LLVVPSNQMPGGISTVSAIPLQGFLPLDGIGWQYMEPRCAIGCHYQLQGRSSCSVNLACAFFTIFSPISTGRSLIWRAAVGQRSYEEWCYVHGGGVTGKYVVSLVALINNHRW